MAAKQLSDYNPDGTNLGQDASDKISFYGKTPVAQASSVTTGTDSATTQAAVNAVITALRNLGLIASP
jgi:hypothetical protein